MNSKFYSIHSFAKKLKHLFPQQNRLDRWDFYQDYIETVLQLVKSPATLPEEDCKGEKLDISFETCHEFLCEVSTLFLK